MHYTLFLLFLLTHQGSPAEVAFDLADVNCGTGALIADVEGAQVFATCASEGDERIMQITVTNHADNAGGPLRAFSLGFCGPSAIQAFGPTDWLATIEGAERSEVTWSLPDNMVDRQGVQPGRSTSGFVVRLRPGWVRSRSESAWWGDSHLVVQATTHDC